MIGIYKITNPKGRIYIGQSINIEQRWNQYKKLYCKRQPKLYNSLSKHGYNEHKFEIIEECLLEQLNEKEIYWKQQYINELGWENLLFCELYDQFSGPQSDETKLKKSLIMKGRKFSSEHIQNMRKARIGKPKPEGFGKKLSKPIIQYNLNGGIIKLWSSGKEASKILKLNAGDITACCKGRQKTTGGFIFKYNKEICGQDMV